MCEGRGIEMGTGGGVLRCVRGFETGTGGGRVWGMETGCGFEVQVLTGVSPPQRGSGWAWVSLRK